MKINIDKSLAKLVFFMLGLTICVFPYTNNTLYKGMILALSVIMICVSIKHRKKYNLKKLSIVFVWALFVVWAYASKAWALYDIDVNRVIFMIFAGIEIFALGFFMDSSEKLIDFFEGIVLGALALCLEIVLFFGVDRLMQSRMTNDLLNSNRAGVIFSIASLFCMFLLVHKKQRRYIFYVLVLLTMIFLTGSRTALLTWMMGITIWFIVFKVKNLFDFLKNAAVVFFILLAVIIVLIKVPAFYNIAGERFINTFLIILGKSSIEAGHNSDYSRTQLLLIGLNLIKHHFIKGIGLDNFRYYGIYGYYAHNNYIEVWADLGIVGFLLFYYPIYSIGKRVRTIVVDRNLKGLLWAYFFVFLTTNMFSVIYNQIFDLTVMACFYYMVCFELERDTHYYWEDLLEKL